MQGNMPRTVRDARIETRAARAKLTPRGKPYWRALTEGCHLGYRRNQVGGKWVLRVYLGSQNYVTETIGLADDAIDAEGAIVRNFAQAQAFARERFIALRRQAAGLPGMGVTTVADVLAAYRCDRAAAGKAGLDLDWRLRAIEQDLGTTPLTKITTSALQAWRDARITTRKPKAGEDSYEAARRARASATRLWTCLRAALNHAHRSGLIASDDPWRRVRALPDAGAARERFLSADEAQRLIRACSGRFRDLVAVAIATGMRYGELCRLRVSDFNSDMATLYVARSKSGKSRYVHLSDEGRDLVASLAAGRPESSEPLLRRNDGSAWDKDHQRDPMAEASRRAGITPAISFHMLRHSYCSLSIMNGMPLMVVARNLGHADTKMVERHYGHLAPSYMADEVQRSAPRLGISPGN
jgi:integrase